MTRRHRVDPGRVAQLMERLRLRPELLGRRPAQVSGGELQRLAVLRVMLLDPVVLFADEPTSRLDPITQQEVVGLLTGLTHDGGCALVLVSHDPALIGPTADRTLSLGSATGEVPAPVGRGQEPTRVARAST